MRMNRAILLGASVLLAINGCTNKAPAVKPTAQPSESASPFPSPSVSPRSAGPQIGYVSPRVRVSASATPWEGLTIHTRVKAEVALTNDSEQTYKLGLYYVLPSGVTWKLSGTPRGARVSQDCEAAPPANPCTPSDVHLDITLPPKATRQYGFDMELIEFRCPGQGDFSRLFGFGIGGPVASGPNGYDIAARFENDSQDYRRAYGTPPPKYNCDVQTTY
jgi:hypothetical protein